MNLVETYPFPTLPDRLMAGLKLVFVGVNPGVYSLEHGHYFARRTNRFWPAFSRSKLSGEVRESLGREELEPEDDAALLEHGIGFTDVVKLPTRNASALTPEQFQEWAPRLLLRLERYRPRVACFHGVTAFGAFARYALGDPKPTVELGHQSHRIGETRLYVVPNPSPANARFTLQDQISWYDRLAAFI